MSKIFRITVASAVVAGVATLTPLSAQAKAEPELRTDGSTISVEACASEAADDATGSIVVPTTGGYQYSIQLPAAAAADSNVYEARARVYTLVNGKQSFTTKRTRIGVTNGFATGTVPSTQHIWRLDVSNLTAEAAGLPNLAFTSAGFINCD